jgi:opacity protein-like surface antigen
MVKTLRNFSLLFAFMPLFCRDVLLEFKASYFYPTSSCTRDIYGRGGALYGPEVTFQLCQERNWYGFASADFLSKKGHSVGLCEPTKMDIVPLAIGLKYFVPFCYGDFYLGLGFQPVHLKTVNCSTFVSQTTSKWGFGGIAKIGTYFDLPCNFFVDIFLDYSFVKVGCSNCGAGVTPLKADLSGVIFGAGLGYRFN